MKKESELGLIFASTSRKVKGSPGPVITREQLERIDRRIEIQIRANKVAMQESNDRLARALWE